jgi:hypothetical protein
MTSMPTLSPAFNDFLYATVCEERNEMPLSVISALARLDLDPWTEAAALAGMPADRATLRLSGLLAGFVDAQPAQQDRATITARLVALLPQPAKASVSGRGLSAGAQKSPRFSVPGILCLALLVSMATSFVMANLQSDHGALDRTSKPSVSASRATTASTGAARPSPH